MAQPRILSSVVTRVVFTLVAGGFLVSLGLAILEFRRAENLLQLEETQRTALHTRHLQNMLRSVVAKRPAEEVHNIVQAFISGTYVRAVRLEGPDIEPVRVNEWPDLNRSAVHVWIFAEQGISMGDEVHMHKLTVVQAPFSQNGTLYMLELLVDGPAARSTMRARVINQLAAQWLLLAVLLLLGLLLLRRWLTGPLSEVMQLTGQQTAPVAFHRLSAQLPGEFSHLTGAIGDMLERLDLATHRLRQREQAFENLYQFAPAAMVSLDAGGRIVEANRRAAELFRVADEQALLGEKVLDFIRTEDRARLRQTIDRLNVDNSSRCHLAVIAGRGTIDVAVESTGVRDENGALQMVRLSLLDVSESSQLQRELGEKNELLKLLIDHMSDAILLVDAKGRIAAHNEQLLRLLRCKEPSLIGQPYDTETFWNELSLRDETLFVGRMRQIEAQQTHAAQEQFQARAGTFLFQGIPVDNGAGQCVGRLWVVQDITSQEQSQRLLATQTKQLQALRQLGQTLRGIVNVHQLLDRAGGQMFELFGVEAVGIALRHPGENTRSLQILHRGADSLLMEQSKLIVDTVERHVMPQVLSHQQVTYWADLPRKVEWAKVFEQAGLTCVAAVPIVGSGDAQGILWIARSADQRLGSHHIYLLEALAPIIAARLEIAQLHERLQGLHMTDPVTDLPNRKMLEHELRKLGNRPGFQWALICFKLDYFGKLNDLVGHEEGDQLLRKVATVAQRMVRKGTVLARLHDSHFVLTCPGADAAEAGVIADRLRQSMNGMYVTLPDKTRWQITGSFGVASSPAHGVEPTDVLQVAIEQVDAARREGRNRVAVRVGG